MRLNWKSVDPLLRTIYRTADKVHRCVKSKLRGLSPLCEVEERVIDMAVSGRGELHADAWMQL